MDTQGKAVPAGAGVHKTARETAGGIDEQVPSGDCLPLEKTGMCAESGMRYGYLGLTRACSPYRDLRHLKNSGQGR